MDKCMDEWRDKHLDIDWLEIPKEEIVSTGNPNWKSLVIVDDNHEVVRPLHDTLMKLYNNNIPEYLFFIEQFLIDYSYNDNHIIYTRSCQNIQIRDFSIIVSDKPYYKFGRSYLVGHAENYKKKDKIPNLAFVYPIFIKYKKKWYANEFRVEHCSNCKTFCKTLKCSGCLLERYCSKECQRDDWKYHKEECGYDEHNDDELEESENVETEIVVVDSEVNSWTEEDGIVLE
jgi:hypothetical protein